VRNQGGKLQCLTKGKETIFGSSYREVPSVQGSRNWNSAVLKESSYRS